MRKEALVAVLAAATAMLLGPAGVAEPANLGPHKNEIRRYVETGQYDRELAAVATQAGAWIERRVKQGSERMTVVFDLDETLISNWPEIERQDFGFDPKTFPEWVESAQCPAIEPLRRVYGLARRLGVEVVFITGRREESRAATVRNLAAVGCTDYVALVCKPDEAKETSAKFKAAERARLESEGRTIIANIGDQESDLAGGHAERTFKLPNPFYLSE